MQPSPRPTPAIVAHVTARRLPRWVLLSLGLVYVLSGFWGRQPWRGSDLSAFGVMLDMAEHGHWLTPQVLGEAAEFPAYLPYWLGAAFIRLLPFWPADLASRVPYAGLLAVTLLCTWGMTYHLARLPQAQPVAFAFGGQADPKDYARALADTAVLALLASLGLAQLSHEATPDAAQLAATAVFLLGCARLTQRPTIDSGWSVLLWGLGLLGMTLSGAPWLGLILAIGWLWGWWRQGSTDAVLQRQQKHLIGACLGSALVSLLTIWQLQIGINKTAFMDWRGWYDANEWRSYARLLLWFCWPVGLLGIITVWRWRKQWNSPHLWLPIWAAGLATGCAWVLDASDRALLLTLPPLAALAAFTVPTLSRSITALIDWFALLFFSGCAFVLWFYWLAMQTGIPSKPASNVLRMLPGFSPSWDWGLLLPAVLGSLAWLTAVIWRLGRYRPALWKGLVLSAGGSSLCWLLLMTLWLPALNYGMGQAPISQRIAALVPKNSCVLVHGLSQSQIAGLQYHGQLQLERAGTNPSDRCRLLVVEPKAQSSLGQVVSLGDWQAVRKVPRLRENRDGWLVYSRR